MTGTVAIRQPARSPVGSGCAASATVFVLAHHDDEVFCAGHLLQALIARRRILILWATIGGLAPARRRLFEGTRVSRVLGLPHGATWDLGLPDQGGMDSMGRIADAAETLLDTAMRRDNGGSPVVYVPAYEGGHPDHDAVNLAVAVLRSRRPEIVAREFPVYRLGRAGISVQTPRPAAGTSKEPFDVLPLGDDALALRRRLARANSSQLLPSLLPLLALARAAGRGQTEPSRSLPAHDYRQPPHSGRLLYELYTRRRFAGFHAAADVMLAGRVVTARHRSVCRVTESGPEARLCSTAAPGELR